MTAEIIFGTDFHARRDREAAELHALSQAMAPDEVFVDEYNPEMVAVLKRAAALPPERTFKNAHDAIAWLNARDEVFVDLGIPTSKPEMSIEERVRRSIYHGAGLPYPKDSA